MEFHISDLLDNLSDAEVPIRCQITASESRIKELTMKKIHLETNHSRPRRKPMGKLLLIAAMIALLAVPVLAATVLQFTDWSGGINNEKTDYVGMPGDISESITGQLGGWEISLAAQNASADALTLVCTEIDDYFGEKAGILTTDDNFWLEQWNGSKYVPLSAKTDIPAGEVKTIATAQTITWHLGWADSYGALDSGSYRLGKIFSYTDPAGEKLALTYYAEFRVFTEEMERYIDQCKAAMDALYAQDSYHLTFTMYGTDAISCVQEIWKNGDDYLLYQTDFDEDGSVRKHLGSLLRDDIGYSISWAENNVLSGVAEWDFEDYVTVTSFDMWYTFLSMLDSSVGEVYVEGNQINIVSSFFSSDSYSNYSRHWELTYAFDEHGHIVSAYHMDLPELYCSESEKKPIWAMEIHDTSADEIAHIIAAQGVGAPYSFSWAEDQVLYPAGAEGVKTSGFVNTDPRTIKTAYDALMAAKAEYDLVYYSVSKVSYDETAQMWKVEFTWTQNNSYQAIYMDVNGITQLTVTK